MAFEFLNIGIEPDGPAEVKGLADLIQRMKYFMCPGIFCVVCDRDVPDESIVFAYFSPYTKHKHSPCRQMIGFFGAFASVYRFYRGK